MEQDQVTMPSKTVGTQDWAEWQVGSQAQPLPALPKNSIFSKRSLSNTLAVTFLLLLLGGSLLTFGLINQPAETTEQSNPAARVTVVPTSRQAPVLQVAMIPLDFVLSDSLTADTKTVTLRNGGQGQVFWQASSDEKWITMTPPGGRFTQTSEVKIMVNRGELQPGTYTGHVSFKQTGGAASYQLPVILTIE